jgi:glycosyltransferase involved in cell wall biosynthesis
MALCESAVLGVSVVRVLMLSWEHPPYVVGGLGRHVAELAPALVRAGVEVHIVTQIPGLLSMASRDGLAAGIPSHEVTEAGVTVHRVPLANDNADIYDQACQTNQAVQALAGALIDGGLKFDLIHAHDWLMVFAAYELKTQYHLPLIATIHATEQGRMRGGVLYTDLQRNIHGAEQWLAYEAARVIVCSHHMASEVQSIFHTPAEKIDVVPNGVNFCENGRCSPTDLEACRIRYTASGGPIIFTVGRLVHEKGFHLLVEAAPRILAEFPNAHFVIAGQGPEAPYLAEHARALDIAEHVSLPGFVDDKERDCLYRLANCAVFPSLYEPFGIVALEAMAAGCPVVVTEIGGFREVVRHDKTGITVYPNDAYSLAWGVLHTLRDPALAAARAEEARQAVCCEFNWGTIAERTKAVYEKVLDETQHE